MEQAIAWLQTAVQVAVFQTFQLYQQLRDDAFKWIGISYHHACNGMGQATIARKVRRQMNPLLALCTIVVPAVRSVQVA
jgi:hypothetical protein